ncbi:hypothetical protein BaRGS_00013721 [Batillaria attramentaria]|uniref:Uncharacterized protein n=1 Tax=Batillaria attramentaria TaxID=370345 RepID=A0ABD0L741_9CAEN
MDLSQPFYCQPTPLCLPVLSSSTAPKRSHFNLPSHSPNTSFACSLRFVYPAQANQTVAGGEGNIYLHHKSVSALRHILRIESYLGISEDIQGPRHSIRCLVIQFSPFVQRRGTAKTATDTHMVS